MTLSHYSPTSAGLMLFGFGELPTAANGRGGPQAASAIGSCGRQAGFFLPARSAMAGKGAGGILFPLWSSARAGWPGGSGQVYRRVNSLRNSGGIVHC